MLDKTYVSAKGINLQKISLLLNFSRNQWFSVVFQL